LGLLGERAVLLGQGVRQRILVAELAPARGSGIQSSGGLRLIRRDTSMTGDALVTSVAARARNFGCLIDPLSIRCDAGFRTPVSI
jgi:hypothetical protein